MYSSIPNVPAEVCFWSVINSCLHSWIGGKVSRVIQKNLFFSKVMFSISWAHPRLEVGHMLGGNWQYHSSIPILFSYWWDKMGGRVEGGLKLLEVFFHVKSSITIPKKLCTHWTLSMCSLVWRTGCCEGLFFFVSNNGINSHMLQQLLLKYVWLRLEERSGDVSKFFCYLLSVWASQLVLTPGSYGFKHVSCL